MRVLVTAEEFQSARNRNGNRFIWMRPYRGADALLLLLLALRGAQSLAPSVLKKPSYEQLDVGRLPVSRVIDQEVAICNIQ